MQKRWEDHRDVWKVWSGGDGLFDGAMLVVMGICAGQHCIMLWCCRYSARQRRRFRFRVAVVFVRVFVFVLFLVVDLTWIGWNHAEETFGP